MFDLSSVSNLVADAALSLGGSDFHWHKAIFCPYVDAEGKACYNEDRGTTNIECPVCGGEGVVYADPVFLRGIYTDNSNKFYPDGSGGFIKGEKTLSLPRHLDLRLLKERNSGNARRLLRDKFELLGPCCREDGTREIREVLYMKSDPVVPTINSGKIYKIVEVANNY